MTASLRLFVAVDPSAEAVQHLATVARGLRTAGRARPESWHVTLAFLGEVEPAALPGIEAALARAAGATHPGRLRVAGGGRFGDAVLWAGLDGDLDALQNLAATVRSELVNVGASTVDGRPYRPHLTLARRGRREPVAALRSDVAALAGYRGPEWPLDQLRLMRSWLGAEAKHELIRAWPLTA
jgi:2'-5' RNA ligase